MIGAKLIRVAIHLYPPKWRRRYGDELEQLSIDLLNRRPSARRKARLFLDLITHGVETRAHAIRPAYRAGLVSFGAAAVVAAVMLSGPRSHNLLPTSYHVEHISMVYLMRPTPARIATHSMSIVALAHDARSRTADSPSSAGTSATLSQLGSRESRPPDSVTSCSHICRSHV